MNGSRLPWWVGIKHERRLDAFPELATHGVDSEKLGDEGSQ